MHRGFNYLMFLETNLPHKTDTVFYRPESQMENVDSQRIMVSSTKLSFLGNLIWSLNETVIPGACSFCLLYNR